MSQRQDKLPETLITTYLEMIDPLWFRPAYRKDTQDLMMVRMGYPDLEYYRFLYRAVGEIWRWRDRLLLSDTELAAILASPTTTVNVLLIQGVPAGYLELNQQDTEVEIAYFGLRPPYWGQGLGKHLLSHGIAQAWQLGVKRIWVHTCNLDGPYALENYLKRGFQVYRTEEQPMPQRYVPSDFAGEFIP